MHFSNEKLPVPVAVIGLGNTLMGDDGAGARVISLLQRRNCAARLHVVTTPGFSLLTYFDEARAVVIVDAAEFGGAAGDVRRFTIDELLAFRDDRRALTLHDADIPSVVAYARQLGMAPNVVVVYGIQAAQVEPHAGLSAEVEQGCVRAAGMIGAEVGDIGN
jgi:hydrogenase maturation protease